MSGLPLPCNGLRPDWPTYFSSEWTAVRSCGNASVGAMPPIGPSPTNTLDVLLHQNPTIAANSCAMVATVTIPPGDPGSGPHRHSGPVFGYVLEGEILFE